MGLDLRTGRPVWLLKDFKKPGHQLLDKNIVCDTLVVGGGISGALVSHALMQKGFKVTVVDNREVGAASTSASTAILSYEPDTHLQDLIKNIGVKQSLKVYREGIKAIKLIGKLVKTLDDNCGYRKRNNLYFASSKKDSKVLEEEYRLRKKYGFIVEFLNHSTIEKRFSFKAPCALLTSDAAEIDPVRFTRGLFRALEKKGLNVFSHTKIIKYKRTAGISRIFTENGQIIKAKRVVFATGYESQQFLKQKNVRLISSYAIASQPVKKFPGWYKRSIIWESARPYLYARTTSDNRIIIGGEDVDFVNEKKRDALLGKKTVILEKKIKKMFPKIKFKLAAAWTGTFAESKDGLPYIGKHKKFPGAYFVLGYGGNGTTFSAMASQIIRDLILKQKNPSAEIFKFER